jgi:hypothetical protein
LTTGAQPNITSIGTLSSLSVTGNVSAGNISATLFTGVLATGAQPNITSVGTLTSLSVSGNANVGGNIQANGLVLTNQATANLTAVIQATVPIIIDGVAYKIMLTQ